MADRVRFNLWKLEIQTDRNSFSIKKKKRFIVFFLNFKKDHIATRTFLNFLILSRPHVDRFDVISRRFGFLSLTFTLVHLGTV